MYPFLICDRRAAALLVFLSLVAAPPLLAQTDSRLSIDEALGIAQGNACFECNLDGARAARELAVAGWTIAGPGIATRRGQSAR
ncbi:MAG: hypothetical protein IPK34_10245 [Ramlibacter sp.]|nr:hypothetical protein [Ramlibacter sp.]